MPSTAQLCVKVTRKAYRTKKCWKFTSEDRKHKDLLKVRDEICGKPRRVTEFWALLWNPIHKNFNPIHTIEPVILIIFDTHLFLA